jgi:hypothetical protein
VKQHQQHPRSVRDWFLHKNSHFKMTVSQHLVCDWLSTVFLEGKQIEQAMLKKWSQEITERYCEPVRHYHTGQHLTDMMIHLESCKDLIADQTSLTFAVLFHEYEFIKNMYLFFHLYSSCYI